MRFVTRAQWGARPVDPKKVTALRNPVGVTIHWEGPRMGSFTHDRCAGKVRGIQDFHMDTRRWADVAYTAIVCPHGHVFECRGIGVRTAANGTDAGNDSWYAVCALVGVGDPVTPELLAGLDDAIGWLRDHGAGPRVNAHRDHKDTECPGDRLTAWAHGPHDAPVLASRIPDLDAPAPAAGTPASLEDDMVRVMNFGDGHMWLVDIGAKTKWRIPGPGQLGWLEALGVPTVHGVQGGGVGSLFKEIS